MRRSIGLCVVMATLSACSNRSAGTDRTPIDGGHSDGTVGDATPGVDGGGTDAGHLPDGAPIDGGSPTDGGARTDSGGIDAAVSCSAPLTALPAEALPRCSAATHDCINGCIADAGTGTPVACVAACEADDITPSYLLGSVHLNCGGCLNREQRRCIQDHGCADQVAALDCCVAMHCPDGSCVSSTCMSQYSAFASCAMVTAGPCTAMPLAFGIDRCFADVDAGT